MVVERTEGDLSKVDLGAGPDTEIEREGRACQTFSAEM